MLNGIKKLMVINIKLAASGQANKDKIFGRTWQLKNLWIGIILSRESRLKMAYSLRKPVFELLRSINRFWEQFLWPVIAHSFIHKQKFLLQIKSKFQKEPE